MSLSRLLIDLSLTVCSDLVINVTSELTKTIDKKEGEDLSRLGQFNLPIVCWVFGWVSGTIFVMDIRWTKLAI